MDFDLQGGTGHREIDPSLQHCLMSLERIDARLRREVRRWQLAGQDMTDQFRGLYISDTTAEDLLKRPVATSWGQQTSLPAEEEEHFRQLEEDACTRLDSLGSRLLQLGCEPRLDRLRRVFGLTAFEIDAFLVCLAPSLDLRYERIYGYLQDDVTRRRPSVNLILDLLCPAGPERLLHLASFDENAPLFRWELLKFTPESANQAVPLLSRLLAVDESVLTWLLGSYSPSAEFRPYIALEDGKTTEEDRLLAAESIDLIISLPKNGILAFEGPDEGSKEAAGRLFAARNERRLLRAALQTDSEDPSPLRLVGRALRDARLLDAIPYLSGWEACLHGNVPVPGAFNEVLYFPGAVIIGSHATWQASPVSPDRPLVWAEFSQPGYDQRSRLWRYFRGEDFAELPILAGQFKLESRAIRDAVYSARSRAAMRGGPVQAEDLFAEARAYSNPSLAGLARKITPRYTWEDIILPADGLAQLEEIIATVRSRAQVLEVWGAGQKLAASQGLTVLFAGPPGTGKTMAAEILSGELGLDLYKIDLSTVVSKYIGETEKNLERIFQEAASSNAILFFDEADAIFGKRSEVRDAHDRYANLEISYLLQRMEAYDGITILATNLRANLDDAFTRRLQFAVDFPFPDENDRLRIWEGLFPPGVPRAPDLDLERLARRYKLAGGSIRNILLGAAYLAAADGGVVTMEHLQHSARRELQKMGRLVVEND
jgi:hypothetical protein